MTIGEFVKNTTTDYTNYFGFIKSRSKETPWQTKCRVERLLREYGNALVSKEQLLAIAELLNIEIDITQSDKFSGYILRVIKE